MSVIVKLLSPKKQIVVQQIENEYIILITAQESDKGLSPLINDTNKLLDFVHKNDTEFKNVFRDECKITFSTTNKKRRRRKH